MELEQCLKDLKTDDSCRGNAKVSVHAGGSKDEWMYRICRQDIKIPCAYPLRECLPDHIVVGFHVENTGIKLYGLKSLPKVLKWNEVQQLFENKFQDTAEYFRQCRCLMVRRSQADQFEPMADDCCYAIGDFFSGVVEGGFTDSVAVCHQASIAYSDVYRRASQQQPMDSEPQMAGAMKHIQKQSSASTAPNNVVSVEANGYNSIANHESLDNCVTQHCINVEQSDKNPIVPRMSALQIENEAMVPGKYACAVVVMRSLTETESKGKSVFGTAEQVLPNNHTERVVQFKDSQMVIGSSVHELNTCPFADGAPEDIACYVHALEIAYSVSMTNNCTPATCNLIWYILKQEIEDLKSRQTASERLKSFIREPLPEVSSSVLQCALIWLQAYNYKCLLGSIAVSENPRFREILLVEKLTKLVYNIYTTIIKSNKFSEAQFYTHPFIPTKNPVLHPALYELVLNSFLSKAVNGPPEDTTQPDESQTKELHNVLLDNLVPLMELSAEYLDSLYEKDSKAGVEYHERQVELYAKYDRGKLLRFLRTGTAVPLVKGEMGNPIGALRLIINTLGDVEKAIQFATEQKDEELWELLINESVKHPEKTSEFITGLLKSVGTHIDPTVLIQKIPNGANIPELGSCLVKLLQDFSVQVNLTEGCKKILVKDRGCGDKVMENEEVTDYLIFFCGHVYHNRCASAKITTIEKDLVSMKDREVIKDVFICRYCFAGIRSKRSEGSTHKSL
eukprot:Em0004g994a